MPLLKEGRLVDDPWIKVGDDDELPTDGSLILTLERWQKDHGDLLRRNTPLGVLLRSDQPPTLVSEWLDRFGVVALDFPKFTDGRAFSYARMLRERFRFTGEVRAVGAVLRDQLPFMHRCGFDAYEIASATPEEDWREAMKEISVVYQPGIAGEEPAMRLRRARADAPAVG